MRVIILFKHGRVYYLSLSLSLCLRSCAYTNNRRAKRIRYEIRLLKKQNKKENRQGLPFVSHDHLPVTIIYTRFCFVLISSVCGVFSEALFRTLFIDGIQHGRRNCAPDIPSDKPKNIFNVMTRTHPARSSGPDFTSSCVVFDFRSLQWMIFVYFLNHIYMYTFNRSTATGRSRSGVVHTFIVHAIFYQTSVVYGN